MSWWNSSNLTSFASQAFKTAQKSIDKVLDIAEHGSPPSSSLPSEQDAETPQSPQSNKSISDGDNFWNAWLGDGGSEEKGNKTLEEQEPGSISEVFTSGFKSERAKSKVEEAIMSSSTRGHAEDAKQDEESGAPVAERSGSSTSLVKKGGALKLSGRTAKKKTEAKEKRSEAKSRFGDKTTDEDKPEVESVKDYSVASTYDSLMPTTIPDQGTKAGDTDTTSVAQGDKAAPSSLGITDMVSSVSDGWAVEGWAADGQLEDLLQTSMIQKFEEEGEKTGSVESGMTRSLSSSSAVTVQDLEPSLVVAEAENDKSGSESAKETDFVDESTVIEDCIGSTAEPGISSQETAEAESKMFEEVTVDSTDSEEQNIDRSNSSGSVAAEEPPTYSESDKNTEDSESKDVRDTDIAPGSYDESTYEEPCTEFNNTFEEPCIQNELNTEIKVDKSEPCDTEESQTEEENSEELEKSSAVEIADQPSVTESSELSGMCGTVAKDGGQDENIRESNDSADISGSDVKSAEYTEVLDGDNRSVHETDPDNVPADIKKVSSEGELENTEKSLIGSDQDKKASEWVVEMCQLKDSITSTTASDELSDSNRTITSEDVGELSVDVGEAVEAEESETPSDLQSEQMTLKVATVTTNEMVSSTVSSSSSLVKNLEDAMVESMKDNDSHSTTSTEKSSEMVRIESGHNSGHTSGDEIETTTSSDIEIISTPNSNGEYKLERPFEFSPLRYALSRTVRHSPPGHKRSDSSSSGHSNWSKNGDEMLSPEGGAHALDEHWPMVKEEDFSGNPVESEKLLKKLAEMAEVLEAREKKLMEFSRESIDLQEANNILRQQLQQSEEAREVEMSDLTTLTEEFTKRLSEAERKYNNLARERDALKRQLKDTETILTKRSDNSVAVDKLMKEKDQQIAELLAEGEKLSKQQLQSNNIIKKLRNKEKENETLIKSQNQKIESEGAELEHLRKVLDVKEDLEKKQIEAINQLNNLVKKQELENQKFKSDAEDHQEKIRSMQVTLDNSYKEIAELHKKSATKASEVQEARLSVELTAKEELRFSLERHQLQSRQESEALVSQIEDLRLSLTRMEKEHSRKEDVLRQEISDAQQRLQEAEDRNQELTEGVSAATRPLLRQIENLQSTYAAQSSSFERIERNLTERLADAQAQLANAQEKERSASEKFMDISTRIKSLESQVSILRQEKSTLSAQLEMERAKVEALEDTRHSDIAQLEAAKLSLDREITDLKKQQVLLGNQLEMEKMKVESEKKKAQLASDTLKEKELELQLQQSLRVSPEVSLMTRSSHASLSRESSFHDSMSQSLVLPDDGMEKSFTMISPNGNKMSLYETLRQTGASTLIENLQSQLKLREGEISQLQSDITELEKTRESMARELVNVSNEKETLASQVEEYGELKTKFTELDNRYNALLMMYGEKVEEAEELKLDLQDVKDMYKAQIEELVNKR